MDKLKNKIVDCITFFDENYIFDLRYNILKDFVDFFVICESKYDHQGNPKKINFVNKNEFDKEKIKHIVLEKEFQKKEDSWSNQAIQRDFILENLEFVNDEDYIFFSDPDEIPNPETLKDFHLQKKYGIFLQKCFAFKFNIFNPYETPWEGTRVCTKKNLNSIDFMRQKVRTKNLKYNFWRIDKEKSIQIFNNAGWHFNNILSPENISKKLKTFAHIEFGKEKFSSIKAIEEKILEKTDLFERGHKYELVEFNNTFPEYLLKNKKKFKDFIED